MKRYVNYPRGRMGALLRLQAGLANIIGKIDMNEKTGISEAQLLQISTALMMVGAKVYGAPIELEYAGYAATILVAVFTWCQRRKQKNGN